MYNMFITRIVIIPRSAKLRREALLTGISDGGVPEPDSDGVLALLAEVELW